MTVESWSIVWKIVFIIGVSLFAILAAFVIVGGAMDTSKLIKRLKKEDEQSDVSETTSEEE
ncbi:MAG: hypothetical protein KAT31_08100 [Bacteroidales bacterium]|nr:hypothetical protein [Bacteroidales bacterium]